MWIKRSVLILGTVLLFAGLLVWFSSGKTAAAGSEEVASIIGSLAEERTQKTQPIEDESQAMAPFYRALARTAAKQPEAVTRICHFGDSLVEMELVPGPARRLLQLKWGDAGHGFALVSRPWPWYRPYDLILDEPIGNWVCHDMGRHIQDRRFSLGGANAISFKKKAKVKIGTAKKGKVGKNASLIQILFPMEAGGGEVKVKIDGKDYGVLNTAAPNYAAAYAEISLPDGQHLMQLIASDRNIRLHGVILEREGPGIVYDGLGINGSGVETYLSVDGDHWMDQLKHRNPDLVIIGIGTNDTYPDLDLNLYRFQLKRLINRARSALPKASILFMAPLDRAMKSGSKLITNPMTPKVVQTQRKTAKEEGIAFWSAFEAMGGEGSMARWYYAKPRLGAGDLFHPTPAGGEIIAAMFYQALMQGFAQYLEQNGMPGPAEPRPASPLKRIEILEK